MMKYSKQTIAILAGTGHEPAIWHMAFNKFLYHGGHVTGTGLSSLALAKVTARMDSVGYEDIPKSKAEFSIFV